MCIKKLHLPRQKGIMIETLIFFKLVPLLFSTFLKLFPTVVFILMFSTYTNVTLKMDFQFRKEEKVARSEI